MGNEKKLTNGKFEGIVHISDENGLFKILATDQRGSLRRMINPDNPKAVTAEELKEVKLALIKNLVGRGTNSKATGVLIDPEYSYERSFLMKANIPATVGILMGIEKSGYGSGDEFAPKMEIFNDLDVESAVLKIKARGMSAVKLLIYYRTDSPTAKYQESMIKAIGKACAKYDIAFLVEPVTHSLKGGPHKKKDKKEFAKIKPNLVINTARELSKPEYGIDILKMEFPVDLDFAEELHQDPLEYCKALDEASQLPWVLLSAGVDFDVFIKQVEIAAKAGASGFLAGRAIWKDAIRQKERDTYLRRVGVERLNKIATLVERYGRPWYKKFVEKLDDIVLERGE